MKTKILCFICLMSLGVIFSGGIEAKSVPVAPKTGIQNSGLVKLENPISVQYLKKKLRKATPRLVLTPEIEKVLKAKIKTDPVVKNYYAAIKLNAQRILKKPLITRQVVGRRLLGTSREMLYRMTILSMVYRIDKDPVVLKRINDEVTAVSNFVDWHPSHFLDVAEMSLA
ncbi:MAG: hypothetical protein Q8905_16440, partial [Bacteroidota bacterium]|nr:hypothetical protein [Bacteroidota bacterium]